MSQRKHNRKLGFDYRTETIYFLTTCVKDRLSCFGNIESNKMILNQYGKIVEQQILWLQQQYPYFIIHNYVVMPNHVHILCEISVGTGRDLSLQCDLSLRNIKIKSIPELMGAFKTTSSKIIHLHNFPNFKWQRSYHDNIVRNNESFQIINEYIDYNPERWESDTLFN